MGSPQEGISSDAGFTIIVAGKSPTGSSGDEEA